MSLRVFLRSCVSRLGGDVVKYAGDALIALWLPSGSHSASFRKPTASGADIAVTHATAAAGAARPHSSSSALLGRPSSTGGSSYGSSSSLVAATSTPTGGRSNAAASSTGQAGLPPELLGARRRSSAGLGLRHGSEQDVLTGTVTAARRATQCALEIQSQLHNAAFAPGVTFQVRIGIGAGPCGLVMLGDPEQRLEYLLLGPAVQQAIACEKTAKPGSVVVSSALWSLVQPYFEGASLGSGSAGAAASAVGVNGTGEGGTALPQASLHTTAGATAAAAADASRSQNNGQSAALARGRSSRNGQSSAAAAGTTAPGLPLGSKRSASTGPAAASNPLGSPTQPSSHRNPVAAAPPAATGASSSANTGFALLGRRSRSEAPSATAGTGGASPRSEAPHASAAAAEVGAPTSNDGEVPREETHYVVKKCTSAVRAKHLQRVSARHLLTMTAATDRTFTVDHSVTQATTATAAATPTSVALDPLPLQARQLPSERYERLLRACVPGAILRHLSPQLAPYASELRTVSVVFLHLDLSPEWLHSAVDPQRNAVADSKSHSHSSSSSQELLADTSAAAADGRNPDTVNPLARLDAVVRCALQSVSSHGGQLNKVVLDDKGACILSVFGLPPHAHEDDPERAVLCALQLWDSLSRVAGVGCSVGVTTGTAFCGGIGAKSRKEYTVISDLVNTAARLMVAAGDIHKKSHAKATAGAVEATVGSVPQGANTLQHLHSSDADDEPAILVDSTSRDSASHNGSITFTQLPPLMLKGKARVVIAHRPSVRKQDKETWSPQVMVLFSNESHAYSGTATGTSGDSKVCAADAKHAAGAATPSGANRRASHPPVIAQLASPSAAPNSTINNGASSVLASPSRQHGRGRGSLADVPVRDDREGWTATTGGVGSTATKVLPLPSNFAAASTSVGAAEAASLQSQALLHAAFVAGNSDDGTGTGEPADASLRHTENTISARIEDLCMGRTFSSDGVGFGRDRISPTLASPSSSAAPASAYNPKAQIVNPRSQVPVVLLVSGEAGAGKSSAISRAVYRAHVTLGLKLCVPMVVLSQSGSIVKVLGGIAKGRRRSSLFSDGWAWQPTTTGTMATPTPAAAAVPAFGAASGVADTSTPSAGSASGSTVGLSHSHGTPLPHNRSRSRAASMLSGVGTLHHDNGHPYMLYAACQQMVVPAGGDNSCSGASRSNTPYASTLSATLQRLPPLWASICEQLAAHPSSMYKADSAKQAADALAALRAASGHCVCASKGSGMFPRSQSASSASTSASLPRAESDGAVDGCNPAASTAPDLCAAFDPQMFVATMIRLLSLLASPMIIVLDKLHLGSEDDWTLTSMVADAIESEQSQCHDAHAACLPAALESVSTQMAARRNPPVMLIVTTRPVHEARYTSGDCSSITGTSVRAPTGYLRLLSLSSTEVLDLGRAGVNGTAHIVAQTASVLHRCVPGKLAETVHAMSGGNQLFSRRLAQAMLKVGLVVTIQGTMPRARRRTSVGTPTMNLPDQHPQQPKSSHGHPSTGLSDPGAITTATTSTTALMASLSVSHMNRSASRTPAGALATPALASPAAGANHLLPRHHNSSMMQSASPDGIQSQVSGFAATAASGDAVVAAGHLRQNSRMLIPGSTGESPPIKGIAMAASVAAAAACTIISQVVGRRVSISTTEELIPVGHTRHASAFAGPMAAESSVAEADGGAVIPVGVQADASSRRKVNASTWPQQRSPTNAPLADVNKKMVVHRLQSKLKSSDFLPLPYRVQRIVASMLDRLSAPALLLLKTAAVLCFGASQAGLTFDLRDVSAVFPVDISKWRDAGDGSDDEEGDDDDDDDDEGDTNGVVAASEGFAGGAKSRAGLAALSTTSSSESARGGGFGRRHGRIPFARQIAELVSIGLIMHEPRPQTSQMYGTEQHIDGDLQYGDRNTNRRYCYRFDCGFVRDVAYHQATFAQRQRLHKRAAELLFARLQEALARVSQELSSPADVVQPTHEHAAPTGVEARPAKSENGLNSHADTPSMAPQQESSVAAVGSRHRLPPLPSLSTASMPKRASDGISSARQSVRGAGQQQRSARDHGRHSHHEALVSARTAAFGTVMSAETLRLLCRQLQFIEKQRNASPGAGSDSPSHALSMSDCPDGGKECLKCLYRHLALAGIRAAAEALYASAFAGDVSAAGDGAKHARHPAGKHRRGHSRSSTLSPDGPVDGSGAKSPPKHKHNPTLSPGAPTLAIGASNVVTGSDPRSAAMHVTRARFSALVAAPDSSTPADSSKAEGDSASASAAGSAVSPPQSRPRLETGVTAANAAANPDGAANAESETALSGRLDGALSAMSNGLASATSLNDLDGHGSLEAFPRMHAHAIQFGVVNKVPSVLRRVGSMLGAGGRANRLRGRVSSHANMKADMLAALANGSLDPSDIGNAADGMGPTGAGTSAGRNARAGFWSRLLLCGCASRAIVDEAEVPGKPRSQKAQLDAIALKHLPSLRNVIEAGGFNGAGPMIEESSSDWDAGQGPGAFDPLAHGAYIMGSDAAATSSTATGGGGTVEGRSGHMRKASFPTMNTIGGSSQSSQGQQQQQQQQRIQLQQLRGYRNSARFGTVLQIASADVQVARAANGKGITSLGSGPDGTAGFSPGSAASQAASPGREEPGQGRDVTDSNSNSSNGLQARMMMMMSASTSPEPRLNGRFKNHAVGAEARLSAPNIRVDIDKTDQLLDAMAATAGSSNAGVPSSDDHHGAQGRLGSHPAVAYLQVSRRSLFIDALPRFFSKPSPPSQIKTAGLAASFATRLSRVARRFSIGAYQSSSGDVGTNAGTSAAASNNTASALMSPGVVDPSTMSRATTSTTAGNNAVLGTQPVVHGASPRTYTARLVSAANAAIGNASDATINATRNNWDSTSAVTSPQAEVVTASADSAGTGVGHLATVAAAVETSDRSRRDSGIMTSPDQPLAAALAWNSPVDRTLQGLSPLRRPSMPRSTSGAGGLSVVTPTPGAHSHLMSHQSSVETHHVAGAARRERRRSGAAVSLPSILAEDETHGLERDLQQQRQPTTAAADNVLASSDPSAALQPSQPLSPGVEMVTILLSPQQAATTGPQLRAGPGAGRDAGAGTSLQDQVRSTAALRHMQAQTDLPSPPATGTAVNRCIAGGHIKEADNDAQDEADLSSPSLKHPNAIKYAALSASKRLAADVAATGSTASGSATATVAAAASAVANGFSTAGSTFGGSYRFGATDGLVRVAGLVSGQVSAAVPVLGLPLSLRTGSGHAISDWNFDIFVLAGRAPTAPLVGAMDLLLHDMFARNWSSVSRNGKGLTSHRCAELQAAMHAVAVSVEPGYHAQNLYHNSLHAADVTVSAYALMSMSARTSSTADGVRLPLLTVKQRLQVLIACAIHDYAHPGVTGQFLTAAKHPLALEYQQPVLENMHVALAMQQIRRNNTASKVFELLMENDDDDNSDDDDDEDEDDSDRRHDSQHSKRSHGSNRGRKGFNALTASVVSNITQMVLATSLTEHAAWIRQLTAETTASMDITSDGASTLRPVGSRATMNSAALNSVASPKPTPLGSPVASPLSTPAASRAPSRNASPTSKPRNRRSLTFTPAADAHDVSMRHAMAQLGAASAVAVSIAAVVGVQSGGSTNGADGGVSSHGNASSSSSAASASATSSASSAEAGIGGAAAVPSAGFGSAAGSSAASGESGYMSPLPDPDASAQSEGCAGVPLAFRAFSGGAAGSSAGIEGDADGHDGAGHERQKHGLHALPDDPSAGTAAESSFADPAFASNQSAYTSADALHSQTDGGLDTGDYDDAADVDVDIMRRLRQHHGAAHHEGVVRFNPAANVMYNVHDNAEGGGVGRRGSGVSVGKLDADADFEVPVRLPHGSRRSVDGHRRMSTSIFNNNNNNTSSSSPDAHSGTNASIYSTGQNGPPPLRLMQMAVKAADVGNPAKDFAIARKWALLVMQEFQLQGDKEVQLGLPISRFMNRKEAISGGALAGCQAGFISFVALPLFTSVAHVWPETKGPCLDKLKANLELWRAVSASRQAVAPLAAAAPARVPGAAVVEAAAAAVVSTVQATLPAATTLAPASVAAMVMVPGHHTTATVARPIDSKSAEVGSQVRSAATLPSTAPADQSPILKSRGPAPVAPSNDTSIIAKSVGSEARQSILPDTARAGVGVNQASPPTSPSQLRSYAPSSSAAVPALVHAHHSHETSAAMSTVAAAAAVLEASGGALTPPMAAATARSTRDRLTTSARRPSVNSTLLHRDGISSTTTAAATATSPPRLPAASNNASKAADSGNDAETVDVTTSTPGRVGLAAAAPFTPAATDTAEIADRVTGLGNEAPIVSSPAASAAAAAHAQVATPGVPAPAGADISSTPERTHNTKDPSAAAAAWTTPKPTTTTAITRRAAAPTQTIEI